MDTTTSLNSSFTQDLAARLQAALGDAYVLARELDAAGPSRQFLATDPAGREVVVIVFPPDVATVVDERAFREQMGRIANLAHPNLVPLLAAGTAPGLLFTIVPRAAGETLKARLARDFRTSVPEAARIMEGLCAAAHHAHRSGILHGDLSAEQVVLQDGIARLANVGIAAVVPPALASATRGGYLAPEVLHDPAAADIRGDVYSLGIVAYETLAGERPFESDAHARATGPLVAEPPRLAAVRRDIPRPLSDVVARAMSRDPARRFRTAKDFGEAFAKAARAPSVRTRNALIAVGLMAAAAVIALTVVRATRRHGIDDAAFAIVPFDVEGASVAGWREGVVDLVASHLDGMGGLRSVPADLTVGAWGDARGADHRLAADFARRLGARRVLYGRIAPLGAGSVRATAFVVDALDGSPIADLELTEDADRLDRLADSLTVQVLRALGQQVEPRNVRLRSLGTSDPRAISAFVRGESHFRRADYDSARIAYRLAVQHDSDFTVALSRLWRLTTRAGLPRDAELREGEAAGRRAVLLNLGLAPVESIAVRRDSLLFAMIDAPSGETLGDLGDVVTTAVERYPRSPETWMIAAEERSGFLRHRGATNVDVLAASERSIALDSLFIAPYLTAFSSAWEQYGWNEAVPYLEALLRHRPRTVEGRGMALLRRVHDGSPSADSLLLGDTIPGPVVTAATSFATLVMDSTNTALRLAYLRLRLQEPLQEQERAIIAATLLSHGRWREARRVGGIAAVAPELPLVPGFSRDSVVAWTAQWVTSVRAGQFPFRPHALLWRAAELGRTDLVTAIQEGARRVESSHAVRESKYVVLLARALVPLANSRDTTAVLLQLKEMGESQCFLGCYPVRVGIARALNDRGELAGAAELLGSGDGAFAGLRFWAMPLTRTLWRLERARNAEASKDPGRALVEYQTVLGVLDGADPELEPVIATAKAGLARLGKAP